MKGVFIITPTPSDLCLAILQAGARMVTARSGCDDGWICKYGTGVS